MAYLWRIIPATWTGITYVLKFIHKYLAPGVFVVGVAARHKIPKEAGIYEGLYESTAAAYTMYH